VRSISLSRHAADIAVRVGTLVDVDLIAKPVGSMAFGFYGTPAQCTHVESGGLPNFISFNDESSNERGPAWLMQRFPRSRVALRAENHVLQAMAARSGVGLALLPHYLGRADHALKLCAIGPLPPAREIWLLIRKRDRTSATVRTVLQALGDHFLQNEHLFRA
jgi:DNA-binding transcriptional LysR family regulator